MTYPSMAEDTDYEAGETDTSAETETGYSDDSDADTDTRSESASGSTGNKSSKPSKATYRRTAAKAIQVVEADKGVRTLAAAVLGGSDDPAELTATIMTAPRGAASALDAIQKMIEAHAEDPTEAVFLALEMEKDIKAVWTLMHSLGAVASPTPPAAFAKAARAFVKALGDLNDDQVLDLAAAAELIKRS